MLIIQCDIREGRTEEEKQALARGITHVVHETIGAPIECIYVLIRETPGRTTSRPARLSPTAQAITMVEARAKFSRTRGADPRAGHASLWADRAGRPL